MFMIEVYDQVRKIFTTSSPIPDMDYVPTYDKSDKDKEDYDSSNKQPDTTNMPESEESAAQRRNQRGQELKILTPQQILSGLSILKQEIIHKNLKMK